MGTTNGFLSDDDELFVNGDTDDPAPFTFQSYLSEDDDAPDPLTLDEIAKVSLAALNSLASPPIDESEPTPTTEEGQENGVIEPPLEEPRNGARYVDIEVRLPWIPPGRRAGYRKIKVDDYRAEVYDDLRTRKRRRRVSYNRPLVVACLLCSAFWLCGFPCWLPEKRGQAGEGVQGVLELPGALASETLGPWDPRDSQGTQVDLGGNSLFVLLPKPHWASSEEPLLQYEELAWHRIWSHFLVFTRPNTLMS